MINVKLNNPPIILTPVVEELVKANIITEEEAKNNFGFAELYVLYLNPLKEVEIGIPDMEKYDYYLSNMDGIENATKKAYFFNGGTYLKMKASEVTDRPIYEVFSTDDRKVVASSIINNVNIGLTDVLNGKFQPKENKTNKLGL